MTFSWYGLLKGIPPPHSDNNYKTTQKNGVKTKQLRDADSPSPLVSPGGYRLNLL